MWPPSLKVVVLEINRKSKVGKFSLQVSGYETASYHAWNLYPFRKPCLKTSLNYERENGLDLITPDKCHVVIKRFDNSEARLWKCYHVTLNSPFFAKLKQHHNADVEKTLWVSMLWLQLCVIVAIYPTLRQHWYNVVNLTSWNWTREEVVNLTLPFQCYNNVVNIKFLIHCELNLISNVETTL